MKRLLPFLLAVVVLPLLQAVQIHAQTLTVKGRVTEVRFFDDPRGFTLDDPDPIPLTDNATLLDEEGRSLSLNSLDDRVFDNRDQVLVRVAFNDDGEIDSLAVVGVNVAPPANLRPEEQSFTLFDVDPARGTLTSTPLPFIEVIPTTLESRGTQIFGEDGLKISLNDLPHGSLVEVVGAFEGPRFVAEEVRVLETLQSLDFGGVVVRIERKSDTHGKIIFRRDQGEWVDPRAPVFLSGEDLGPGLQSIVDILNGTDEPVAVTLSQRNFFDFNEKWGRVEVEVGKTVFGKQWLPDDGVTFQLLADPDRAVRIENDGEDHVLLPAQPFLPVDENTTFFDHTQGGFDVTFADLTEFMDVWINLEVAGGEVISANVNINQHPRDIRITLQVGWFDTFNNRIGFDSGPPIQLDSRVRYFDLSGNPIGARTFEEFQYQGLGDLVALITLDPVSGRGVEARLVEFGATPGPDQVVAGEIAGIHRGFWVNTEFNEIGTHGLDGEFLFDTVVQSQDGQDVPLALLNQGVEVEVVGAVVSGQIFMREVIIQSAFELFDITARIQYIDFDGHWIQFEEPEPFQVDPDRVEVIDHFGDAASLGFLSDLLDQGDLQLLLTLGGQAPDGSPGVSRVEAFRPGEEVQVGSNQTLIDGGRIDPFSFPPLIFPESVNEVQYADETEVFDVSGNLIDARDLQDRVRVRITGQSVATPTFGDPFAPKRRYLAQRIEVLGGVATRYRGILAEIQGDILTFRDPEPVVITRHTDLRDETNFNIDFVTLANRINTEGGLRIWLGADFRSPGAPEVWWARIMQRNEPTPSHIGPDEIIAVFTEADVETRSLRIPPIPAIELTNDTAISGRGEDNLTREILALGARIEVLAEERGGALVAVEIRVESVPQSFELTAPVGFVDPFFREIYLETPPFVTVAETAQIFDEDGNPIDLAELRNRLFNQDQPILIITQSPDSPSDAPIAVVVEMVPSESTSLSLDDNQFIVPIDDPGFRIGVRDRRIEPSPFPPVEVAPDAVILNPDGSPTDLSGISEGSRVRALWARSPTAALSSPRSRLSAAGSSPARPPSAALMWRTG